MNNELKNNKKVKTTVKIFGQTVTVGTKLHAKLVYQQKLFSQNNDY
jgi:hypothetical protein